MKKVIVFLLLFLSMGLSSPALSMIIEGEGRTIHILCLDALPPYLIESKDGNFEGFYVDLFRSIAKTEKLRVSLRSGGWEDLRRSIHRGQIDVILGAPHPVPSDVEPFSYLQVYNVDPAEFIDAKPLLISSREISGKDMKELCFSIPIVEESYSCFIKKGSDIRSIRNLRNQPVVALKNGEGVDYLKSSGLTDRIFMMASIDDIMRTISSGVYEAALVGTYHGLYSRKKMGFENIEYLTPPVLTVERGMVVTKGDVGLTIRLTRAFEILRQNGSYHKMISRWFGSYDKTFIDKDMLIKIGAFTLCIISLVIAWNLALKRKLIRIDREREKILDFIRDGIVVVNRSGRVTMINSEAKSLLAVDDSVVGTMAEDTLPDIEFLSVLEGGEPLYDVEQRIRGSLLLGNKIPIVFRGVISGAIATFRDMTEVHALAEEITGVRMYVDSLRVQNHEFQNKLQAIAGLIQMKRYQRAIEFITNEATPDSSSTSFVSESIKNPAVGGILIGKVGRCKELGIDINIDPDSYCGESRDISDQALVVIVGNLLENAIEAVLASGVGDPRIDFAIFDESNQLMVSIQDNGGRMTSDISKRVFEKGFTTKKKCRPSGFGLHNTKKLVDAMGGDLCVDFVPGEYTEFIVTLPNGG